MASRLISDLDPRFQPLVKQFLAEANTVISPWAAFITDGFRTYADQAKLYAQGRTAPGKIVTNAKPGTSNHEKGIAVDIAFQKGGQLSYEMSLYKKIVPIAKKLGISWGGEWVGFKDNPHFEKLTFDKPTAPVMQIGGWYINSKTGKSQRYWGNNVWTDGADPNATITVSTSSPNQPQTTITENPTVSTSETPTTVIEVIPQPDITPVNELPTQPDVVPVKLSTPNIIQRILVWFVGTLVKWIQLKK